MSESDKEKSNTSSNLSRISKTSGEVCHSSKEKVKKVSDLGGSYDNKPLKGMQESEPQPNDHGLSINENSAQEVGNNETDEAGACNNENTSFYRNGCVPGERLRLYERIWRAMRLFIDETRQQDKDLDLKTTRFMVSFT